MDNVQIIDRATARKAIFMAKTLEHKDRQAILSHIIAAGDTGCTVGNIYTSDSFRNRPDGEMEQSECSQQLAWLRKYGFVSTKREGKFIIYTANKVAIVAAKMAIEALAKLMP